MKLPKKLNKVNIASKVLIMVLFILLAFIGFLFGMKYLITKFQTVNNKVTLSTPTNIQQVDTSNWKTYKNEKYSFSFTYPFAFAYLEPHELVKIKQYFEKDGAPNNGIDVVFYKTNADKNIIKNKCVDQPNEPGYFECFEDLMVLHVVIKEQDWTFNESENTSKRDINREISLSGWGKDPSQYLPGLVSGFQAKIFKDTNGDINAFVDYSEDKFLQIAITGYDSYHGFKASGILLNSIKF